MKIRLGSTVLLAAFLQAVYADADSEIISLLPPGPQNKPKGENVALTCSFAQAKKDLISNPRWLDPKNNEIDAAYRTRNSRFDVQHPTTEKIILLINKLSESDIGNYTCIAEYNSKSVSKSSVVNIFVPITWIDAPTEQSAVAGLNYKVKCRVEANPAPEISWARNGKRLGSEDPHFAFENDGLVIQQVHDSDDGSYSCEVVVAETGEYKKRDIHLEVISKPVIQPNLTEEHNVVEGESTDIQCRARGKPKPSISWIKTMNGQNLSTNYEGTLHIDKITKEDHGIFKCVATNKAGTDQRAVRFNVQSKPEIIESVNATIPVGGSGKIQCYVYGNPDPKISIRKQGTYKQKRDTETNEIPTQPEVITDPKRRPHVLLATLNFNHVERYMDGLYECIATNKIGDHTKTTTQNIHLTVQFKPVIKIKNVKEVSTWNERPANLTCLAEAIPNATVSWYFGNDPRPISTNPTPYYTIYGSGGNSALQVTPRQRERYGRYKCIAKNDLGEDFHEIELKEAFPPSALSSVEVALVTATTITFRFNDPSYTGGLPIKGYKVQFIEEPSKDSWNSAHALVWPIGGPYVVDNLLPKRTYDFRFAAINDAGQSEWGGYTTQQTPEISAPSEPVISNSQINAKYIESRDATKIELHWNIPANNGAFIDKYIIRWCQLQEDERDESGFSIKGDCQTIEIPFNEVISSYTIENLLRDTYYQVQLIAHNDIGFSMASTRIFKTSDVDSTSSPAGDNETEETKSEGMSSAIIIYIVVAVLIAFLVILDIFCFFVGNTGVFYLICGTCCGRKKQNDDKLGSESKDLISNGHKKIDIEEQAPMIVDGSKKDTAVEYDLKKGTSKTDFVGKDSAV